MLFEKRVHLGITFFLFIFLPCFLPFHGESHLAASPVLQLLIIDVELDQAADNITIHGENFDNGVMPRVYIDAEELPVLSLGLPNTLVASLEHIPGDLKGNYILEVWTGDTQEQYDSHCFSVDENGNLFDCDDPPAASWEHKDRKSIRHVPKGPPGAETDDMVLFSWKDGPTNINSFSNSWGDPKWFQLDEDYTIDLRLILNYYPEELDRCDDGKGWGSQRSIRLDLLDDLDCLEWSEDKENPVCNSNSNDPGEGYILLRDGVLTVRRGYRWDGASMVFPFTKDVRIYPKTAALMRSTVVHDAFYDLLRMKIPNGQCDDFTTCRYQVQKLADCMLYMLSRQDGYDLRKAKANFTTVREFGWTKAAGKASSWKKHAVANAGADQTQVCAPPSGLSVNLDSTGTKFASLKRKWSINGAEIPGTTDLSTPTVRLLPGTHRVWLEVDYHGDESWLLADRDDTLVDIQPDTEAPIFTSANDIKNIPNEPRKCGAAVSFEVKANDNCGCPVISCYQQANSWFDVGTTPVSCTATDIGNNTVSASFKVHVDDVEAPQIFGVKDPLSIWPLNHKYKVFTTRDFISSLEDNCAVPSIDQVLISKVASDEPEEGKGDGSTLNDIVIAADRKSVQLRAESLENGNGRVYTVYVEVKDVADNLATAEFEVHATNENHGWAINDGVAYFVE